MPYWVYIAVTCAMALMSIFTMIVVLKTCSALFVAYQVEVEVLHKTVEGLEEDVRKVKSESKTRLVALEKQVAELHLQSGVRL